MEIAKRKWPSLLLFSLGLFLLIMGVGVTNSVRESRSNSKEYRALVEDSNPFKKRRDTKQTKVWIGISYIDEKGVANAVLAHVPAKSAINSGDSIVVLIGQGKISAVLKSWTDWVHGAACLVISVWLVAIGIFLWRLLDNPPENISRFTKWSRAKALGMKAVQ